MAQEKRDFDHIYLVVKRTAGKLLSPILEVWSGDDGSIYSAISCLRLEVKTSLHASGDYRMQFPPGSPHIREGAHRAFIRNTPPKPKSGYERSYTITVAESAYRPAAEIIPTHPKTGEVVLVDGGDWGATTFDIFTVRGPSPRKIGNIDIELPDGTKTRAAPVVEVTTPEEREISAFVLVHTWNPDADLVRLWSETKAQKLRDGDLDSRDVSCYLYGTAEDGTIFQICC